MSLEKQYIIPNHPNFTISVHGTVERRKERTEVHWRKVDEAPGIPFVELDGVIVSIPKLLVETFVGNFPGKIISRKGIPDLWTRSGDLEYKVDNVQYDPSDGSIIYLNGVKFKSIPGFSRYVISEDGIIYDIQTERFMHHTYASDHYKLISLFSDEGPKIRHLVHLFVYITYIGELKPGFVIDHKDADVFNNHWTNLQQITQAENVRKSFEMKHRKGAICTVPQIEETCKLMSEGIYSAKEMADMVGIPEEDFKKYRRLLVAIKFGNSYKDIASKYNIDNYNPASRSLLSQNQKNQVIEDVKNGMRMSELVAKYKVDEQVIRRVYKNIPGVGMSKKALSEDTVNQILTDVSSGMPGPQIQSKYNISGQTLWIIKRGEYFKTRSRGYRVGKNPS